MHFVDSSAKRPSTRSTTQLRRRILLLCRWFAENRSGSTVLVVLPFASYKEDCSVVGAILPWNFSALMCAWKLGPALAMGKPFVCFLLFSFMNGATQGNAVVVKPAQQTSLATLRIAELALEAGLNLLL